MVHSTAKLGGTASDTVVGKVAHGLASMTSRWPNPVPDEEAFAAIKAGVDALPPGTKQFLNSAEFYGHGLSTGNLELLARFFEKYPDYADRTFISVKGGTIPGQLASDGSRENLRRSVDVILKTLRGTKRLDLFEPARRDSKYEIEQYAESLKEMVKEGKFDHIGLSEVNAETIRRAHKVMPVAAVEIEVSLQSYEQKTKDVIATCKELSIPIIAYSPLGRGLLTGQIKNKEDLPEGDFRRMFSRFQDETIENNRQLVDSLTSIATRKGITPAQLSIAWVSALGHHVIPLPGSSNTKRVIENGVGGDVELSAEELAEIRLLMEKYPTKGGRYMDSLSDEQLLLWN